jgi:hypothetical protein
MKVEVSFEPQIYVFWPCFGMKKSTRNGMAKVISSVAVSTMLEADPIEPICVCEPAKRKAEN